MRDCGYPGYERHKAEHADLTKKVLEFSRDFEAGRIALSVSVLQFLKDWLVNHIQVNDRKIAAYAAKLPGRDPVGAR
jgi:hemerythrin